ncbi:hypothetical protein [Saccharopolyspora rectivirgula]|jgi:hypothetical protein|uniref:Uncharacterized protein n=1 Tax=Saccharopolyspora rectivirgula TaxID=28042 RepID=A0A073AWP5_9PSEU|nr:hypothetical protein [Saccharopolyspora rectivirgula]KEI43746.1 hypothetical protein GU90_14110 [Saccharopolyspora rectivirgula]
MNYFELPEFAGIYLEDSYVLGITEESGVLEFSVDFVLTESHPRYRPPRPGEQNCYVTGALTFEAGAKVEWIERTGQVYTDAAGEEDLGNIDYLLLEDGHWRAGGDWGEVVVHTDRPPRVTLDT